MKAFRFSLEKVLSFRKRQWESESAALELLLERRRMFEYEREQAEAQRRAADMRIASSPSITAATLSQHAFATACNARAMRRLQIALSAIDTKIDLQRRICIAAKRDYELVDKLREDRWKQWQKEFDRELEEQSQESFLARHLQRRLARTQQTRVGPLQPVRPTPLESE